MNDRVSIIILNWNGWRDTIECLESVYRIDYQNYDVIIVDNASQDKSIEKIKEYAHGKLKINSKFFEYNPENKPIKVFELTEDNALQGKFNRPLYEKYDPDRRLILIKNKENYGFAGGNNIGIKFALSMLNPEYILLLNNDTIVTKTFLSELVKLAEKDARIASVQPLLLKPDGHTIDSLGQEILKYGARDIGMGFEYKKIEKNKEIFGACAAAALYKARVLKEVGIFDEDFFILFEDVDLSWRIRLAGYQSMLCTSSIVYHKRGISGNKKSKNATKRYYSSKNRLQTFIRYYPLKVLFNPQVLLIYIWLLLQTLYYSTKSANKKLFKEISTNIRMRQLNNQNPNLKRIQELWIK
ncbi:glycosyltransferase family 2 protein [Thermococcus sp.]